MCSMLARKIDMIPVCNMCNEPHIHHAVRNVVNNVILELHGVVARLPRSLARSSYRFHRSESAKVKQIAIALNSRFHASYIQP